MLKKYEKFWETIDDPLHRSSDEQYYKDYAEELKLLYRKLSPQRVLELGCGNGALFEPLGFKDVEYYQGVDFSKAMIARFGKEQPGTRLVCTDASSYIDDQKYDLIFSNAVVQNFDLKMVDNHVKNSIAMMHDNSELIMASNLWKALQNDYNSGEILNPLKASKLRAVIRRLAPGSRTIGAWYSPSDLAKVGYKYGLKAEVFGSLHYAYRFHIRFTHI